MMRAATCLWLIVCVSAQVGCEYSHNAVYPSEYHTVAAPIFENRTFYRGVEFDLANALVSQIESRTPYKVAAPGRADTILQGTITRIEQNQLSRRRPGGVPQEVEVTIWVDFEWKDLRTGQTIRDRKGFESPGTYVVSAPVNQPFELAQHQAVERLAEDIVATMRTDW